MLACLLLPVAMFAFKTISDRATTIAQAERDAENTASIVEQNAHNTFETYQLVANLLDEHVRGLSWRELDKSEDLHRYLSRLVREYPRIRALSVIDRDGVARISSLDRSISIPNFADRDYFTTLRDRDAGTVIGQRVHSWQTDSDLLNVARRRTSADGTFDGVVVVTALPTSFIEFWQQVSPDGITAIFRGDGRLLARYPHPQGDLLQVRASEDLLAASRSADRGTLFSTSPLDGRETFVSFRKISGFPVFIAYSIDMEHVLRRWRANTVRDGGVFAIAVAGLMVLALAVTGHARREAAARELVLARTGQLTAEAGRRIRAEAELAAVLRDTVERQEAERKHFARELHDSLGQHVAVLHLGLDGILRRIDDVASVRDQVSRLKTTATEVSHEISRLAWELRPAGLDQLGIETAIRSFVETKAGGSGFPINLYIGPSKCRLSPRVEATLYRVLQEAVTNIIKHADATSADIVLEITGSQALLIIEDHGKGFVWDEAHSARPGDRLGLLGIRERLSLVGGSLEIESALGRGTALFIRVPV